MTCVLDGGGTRDRWAGVCRTSDNVDVAAVLIGGRSFRASFIEYVASARVEFGKGHDRQQTGRVRICASSGQPSIYGDTLDVSLEVVGRFIATER